MFSWIFLNFKLDILHLLILQESRKLHELIFSCIAWIETGCCCVIDFYKFQNKTGMCILL